MESCGDFDPQQSTRYQWKGNVDIFHSLPTFTTSGEAIVTSWKRGTIFNAPEMFISFLSKKAILAMLAGFAMRTPPSTYLLLFFKGRLIKGDIFDVSVECSGLCAILCAAGVCRDPPRPKCIDVT